MNTVTTGSFINSLLSIAVNVMLAKVLSGLKDKLGYQNRTGMFHIIISHFLCMRQCFDPYNCPSMMFSFDLIVLFILMLVTLSLICEHHFSDKKGLHEVVGDF